MNNSSYFPLSIIYDRIVKFHFELDKVSGEFRCDFSIIFLKKTKCSYTNSIKMNQNEQ